MGSDLDDIIDKGLEQLQAENSQLKAELAECQTELDDACNILAEVRRLYLERDQFTMKKARLRDEEDTLP